MTRQAAKMLVSRFRDRTAKVGVVGMGYVGLPLALTFAEKGFSVLGFEVDPARVGMLARGDSYLRHVGASRVASAVADGRLEATMDFGRLSNMDAVLICVSTPLTPQRDPDLSFVVESARRISAAMTRCQLVVLESTTYPGTTDGILRQILEGGSRQCGRDFFLAFSPEREDPGNQNFTTETIPKVIGGVDETSALLAEELYGQVVQRIVRVSSARVAEATKLMENVFRAVNIALVNELKVIYQGMGIDVWEALEAAATKPFGFMRFNPGPGWGGHCIPVDPFYLAWKAREFGLSAKFVELAGEINVRMPQYVVERLQDGLNTRRKAVKDSRILVLGLAYKKDVDDTRESPAFEIIRLLLERGAKVFYHDPHVPSAPRLHTWPELPPLRSVRLSSQFLRQLDAALVVTDHTAVDYERLRKYVDLIVDTRNVFPADGQQVLRA